MTKLGVDVERSKEVHTMMSANGRFKPADKKSVAKVSSKLFKCYECGEKFRRGEIEFGSTVECPVCGEPAFQILEEDVYGG